MTLSDAVFCVFITQGIPRYALISGEFAVKVKKCDVNIYKQVEVSIAKTVYEHEISILEEVFGDGNVVVYKRHNLIVPKGKRYQVEDKNPVVYEVEEVDYEEEYFRLVAQYGTRPGSDVSNAEYIYGRLEERKLQKMNAEKYALDKVVITEFQDDEETNEDVMDYQSMTNAELRSLLKELKVKFPATAPKPILISLINKADRGELEHS